MADILFNPNGDIEINENGDIILTNSIVQAVKIRLQWIYDEWRLGPMLGLKWFEQIWVKNPNLTRIKSLVRNEIMSVDGVKAVNFVETKYNQKQRSLVLRFSFSTDEETYEEEVRLFG